MGRPEVAKANAEVLRDFLGALKTVKSRARVALLAGVTRRATACAGSGKRLNGISPRQKYADACGFTLGELDSLFADRAEATLLALKEREIEEISRKASAPPKRSLAPQKKG
jgi:hypothetical protein